MPSLRVAVVGASGYSGEELVRLLWQHPHVELIAITSRQSAGKPVRSVISRLAPGRDLQFEDIAPADLPAKADIFFLALPHGVAAEYAVPLLKAGKTVFDLSADFRLYDPAVYAEFYDHPHPAPELLKQAVYASPELHRDQIKKSNLLACPGCYPTSILLALAPALRSKLIDPQSIVISSMSGVSGAGKKADVALLFGEINENLRAYSVPKHRHLSEIEQELSELAGQKVTVSFIPHLVPITRGIHTTITASLASSASETEIRSIYEKAYESEKFVQVLPVGQLPEVKNVARTNFIEIAVKIDPRTKRLFLFSAEDNLGKGAASQAIQAMNVKYGFPEETGLLS